MNRVVCGILLGVALVAGSEWCVAAHSIVLVTIDTVRADYLSPGRAGKVHTPALERLAKQGIVFTQAISPVPLTLPAHASLMTATYPPVHGVRDNSGPHLGSTLPTLATILKDRGYATAAFVGSSVLDRSFGLARGFEYYGDSFRAPRLFGMTAERNAKAVIDEALNWLGANRKTPFLIWVHLYDPHAPYEPPADFPKRGYEGEIEYTDQQLDRLLNHLRDSRQFDSTLITVLSDHGEDLSQHGEPTHGFFVYDTVLRIPFLLKLPGNRFAGSRVDRQVRIIDVLPTLLQSLQLPVPASVQGRGLLGYVSGKRAQSLECYAETLYPEMHFGWSRLIALRTGDYKFIDAPQPELYDLRKDPGETKNLYSTQRALSNQLKTGLEALRSKQRAVTPGAVTVSPELRERLKSLGYVTLSTGAAAGDKPHGRASDPKSKVDVYAEIYRGMEAAVQGKFQQALQYFQKALRKDPLVPIAYDYLGSAYLALHRNDDAVESYRKALQLSPGNRDFILNLAYGYLQAERLREAEEGFRLLIEQNPGDWQPWRLLGLTLIRRGDPSEAVVAFQQALAKNPSQPETLYDLARLYQQQKKYPQAVEIFRRLVKLIPDDAELWTSLGSNYKETGMFEPAEEAYQRALSIDPKLAAAYYNYGNLLVEQRNWLGAVEKYRQAIALDPNFAPSYHNLAVALDALGQTNEASDVRQQYLRLRPPPK